MKSIALALVAAAALAWLGADLLASPHGGVAQAVTGNHDSRTFERALQLFRRTEGRRTSSNAALALRAHAEAALAAQRGDAGVRSQAQTLLGVLTVEDAAADRAHAQQLTAAAAAAFRNALRLEPENEDAAADLELLLMHSSGRGSSSPGSSRKHPTRPGDTRPAHAHGATASSGSGGGF